MIQEELLLLNKVKDHDLMYVCLCREVVAFLCQTFIPFFKYKSRVLNLKLGPVHRHAGALIGPEPFQVLFGVSSRDRVFQCVVDCLESVGTILHIVFIPGDALKSQADTNTWKTVSVPVIGREIQVMFDLQQKLFEEADAFVFKLLPLLKHLLHVLHILRGQLVKFFQGFLIAFFSLGEREE